MTETEGETREGDRYTDDVDEEPDARGASSGSQPTVGQMLAIASSGGAPKGIHASFAEIGRQHNSAILHAFRGTTAASKLSMGVRVPASALTLPTIPIANLSRFAAQQGRAYSSLAKLPKFEPAGSAYKDLYGESFAGIAKNLTATTKLFRGIDWQEIRSTWYPPNWDSARNASQYVDFTELAKVECLPLTWAPNRELTYALLDARDAADRTAILLGNAERIITDCLDVLDDLDDSQFLVECLCEALAAYRDGHHRSAQANAASVIDTALREIFPDASPFKFYAQVRKRLHKGDDILDTKMRAIRVVPVSVALLSMLETFHPTTGASVPTRPNRHAAAHAVHPDQYTPSNALKFLLLATAVLAETEFGGWSRALEAA